MKKIKKSTVKDWTPIGIDNDEWIKNSHQSNQKYLYINDEGYVVLATSKLAAWKDKGKTIKKLQSKSQALTFARAYMRNH
jgi:hypothetical protein